MRFLSIAVLFSLVSLVAAFSKRGHSLRNRHTRSMLYARTSGKQNQTAGMYNQTGGTYNQTGGMHNQTCGMHNQTGGVQNQTVGNNNQTRGGQYRLVDQYKGQDFLDEAKWAAFTNADPTHGLVQYVSQDTARSQGMAYVDASGAAVLSVDNKTDLPPNQPRQSMRITTAKTYNGGLFIADFERMPFGCSLWPAYWSVGPNWPNGGEIDILEGVNDQTTNQMTLHTGPQCSLDKNPTSGPLSPSTSAAFMGNVLSTTCASSANDNTGCAFSNPDTSSYGQGFNDNGGGVFAHLWDPSGIKIWNFKRSSIPQDIASGNPDPTSWPTPVAFWSNTACDMASHFIDHSLVIDTTLCGDWAGNAFGSSGCPGTCTDAVAKASNFNNAYWQINSISVYSSG